MDTAGAFTAAANPLFVDGPARAGNPAIATNTTAPSIAASNLLLGLVTGLGLYRGNMLVNLNPPNFCLLLLALSQAAALQLARPALAAVASARWVQTAVGVAGRRSMTVYLWHLPLLAAMSGLMRPITRTPLVLHAFTQSPNRSLSPSHRLRGKSGILVG